MEKSYSLLAANHLDLLHDLNEKSFIERGYPHAYIYKPIDEYLTPDINTKQEINN